MYPNGALLPKFQTPFFYSGQRVRSAPNERSGQRSNSQLLASTRGGPDEREDKIVQGVAMKARELLEEICNTCIDGPHC